MARNIDSMIVDETRKLVELFIQTNASDIELSNITGISSSTVGRRLTNLDYIKAAFPEKGNELYDFIKVKRKQNLQKGKALGGQVTLLNHVYNDEEKVESTKLRLDVLYNTKEKQYSFLKHAALTFRLHLDTLSNLFSIKEEEILENFVGNAGGSYEAITFLFYHDGKNQKIAKENFISYYRELLNAISNKDKEAKKRLIEQIGDSKAIEFRNKERAINEKITDEEMMTLLRYQLKYALTALNMKSIFGINRQNYQRRIQILLENDPELRSDYEYLADYNSSLRTGTHYGK